MAVLLYVGCTKDIYIIYTTKKVSHPIWPSADVIEGTNLNPSALSISIEYSRSTLLKKFRIRSGRQPMLSKSLTLTLLPCRFQFYTRRVRVIRRA
jgi:hypothetical protein